MYKKKKIILASSSKQRQLLLRQLGINDFKTMSPLFDEDNYKVKLPIAKKVVELSYLKANSIKTNSKINDEIIISADTEVFRCGKVFSKCFSKDDVNHLLNSIQKQYTCTVDWTGTNFLGLKLGQFYLPCPLSDILNLGLYRLVLSFLFDFSDPPAFLCK